MAQCVRYGIRLKLQSTRTASCSIIPSSPPPSTPSALNPYASAVPFLNMASNAAPDSPSTNVNTQSSSPGLFSARGTGEFRHVAIQASRGKRTGVLLAVDNARQLVVLPSGASLVHLGAAISLGPLPLVHIRLTHDEDGNGSSDGSDNRNPTPLTNSFQQMKDVFEFQAQGTTVIWQVPVEGAEQRAGPINLDVNHNSKRNQGLSKPLRPCDPNVLDLQEIASDKSSPNTRPAPKRISRVLMSKGLYTGEPGRIVDASTTATSDVVQADSILPHQNLGKRKREDASLNDDAMLPSKRAKTLRRSVSTVIGLLTLFLQEIDAGFCRHGLQEMEDKLTEIHTATHATIGEVANWLTFDGQGEFAELGRGVKEVSRQLCEEAGGQVVECLDKLSELVIDLVEILRQSHPEADEYFEQHVEKESGDYGDQLTADAGETRAECRDKELDGAQVPS
ncbi:uncharacterized protein Triagg1_3685 [Trichoderma aggressivum f. europaeum]|uniref:Uncharacterized protein n=1 Tax=Trichoderma aggressivum f. europaeum TaxID=173218 RepID=A0AAE1M461_9HYPO|nr:hypothetical protein Triagg1_3685 [Trichoderma aggressivum f. europaeum]